MHHNASHSISPIRHEKDMIFLCKTVRDHSKIEPEMSLQEPFIDYGDSDGQYVQICRSARAEDRDVLPEPTAPPYENDDEDFEAFGKSRRIARDEMIQVEGIPKIYILVDFGKWGSPQHRAMLTRRNELLLKLKKKLKKVSFCDVQEVFHLSPIVCGEECQIGIKNSNSASCGYDASQQTMGRSPQQAFEFRKRPALYNIADKKNDDVDVFWI
jgi:hypothetical protein